MATVDTSKLNPAVLSIHLLALLEKVTARAAAEDVHRLRTTVRRLEVQLGDPPAKVAKSLKRLRRKAGKVRDIDVHLALLKPPLSSVSPETRWQNELRHILKDKRARQLGSLCARVAEAAPLLESCLPALVECTPHATVSLRDAPKQVGRARQRFLLWTEEIPADEEGLHQLRIRTKKLRYSLEPLQAHEEAAALVAKLKQVQDAIGKWHDLATLEQFAARSMDPAESAPVLGALHAHSEREYRRARRIAQSVRDWLSEAQPALAAAAHASPRLIRKAG